MGILSFAKRFAAKYSGRHRQDNLRPVGASEKPDALDDPLHDKHNPRARLQANVNAITHPLHLTLPAKPAKAGADEGFAVIHTQLDQDAHDKVMGRLASLYYTGRIAARQWHNAHDETAVAPGHGEGRYVSVRGDAGLVRHVVKAAGEHNVAHASDNVLSS